MAKFAPICIAEAICITSLATGAVFSIQNGQYQSGPMYPMLAVLYLFYICFSVVLLTYYWHGIRPYDYACALGFNIALLIGTTVRLIFPRLLAMDTFCVMAILIIYVAFVNPDLYLYDNGKVFNLRGLRMLMAEPERQVSFGALGIALQNYVQERGVMGGQVMDETIGLVSGYLGEAFPQVDLFYLRGGRFILLGEKNANWVDIHRQVLDRFEQPWATSGSTLHLGISAVQADSEMGLSSSDRIVNTLLIALDSAHQNAAVENADGAENPISLNAIDKQVQIMRSLERALENDAVEVFLQPIFSRDMHTLLGAEALARIRDDEGQIIAPGLFVPIAERCGYINQLGRQVMRKTCAFIRENDLDAMGMHWINVNVSPLQCLQDDIVAQFDSLLCEFGVQAEKIRLELTEQSMVDYSLLQGQIEKLQTEGFRFVLDDYGTGYSNLTRVKHYPFVTIKLDMEVVWDYYHERDALLSIIVDGFKEMGLTITAEGVETAEMASVLAELGCDYLQGFYFSEPVPQEDFVCRFAAKG